MSKTGLKIQDNGQFAFIGELSFTNVDDLSEETGQAILQADTDCVVDLQQVSRVDSAGLALLIHLLRLAKQQGKSIRFLNAPKQLLAVAKFNGVDTLLAIEGE